MRLDVRDDPELDNNTTSTSKLTVDRDKPLNLESNINLGTFLLEFHKKDSPFCVDKSNKGEGNLASGLWGCQ